MWYVIQEYETFAQTKPKHAWRVCHRTASKKEAHQKALEFNFEDYCKNKVGRFPKELANKAKLTKQDIIEVVLHVLKMITTKSGSKNSYWGSGYYIIDDTRIKLPPTMVHIDNIHEYLIKSDEEPKQQEQNGEKVPVNPKRERGANASERGEQGANTSERGGRARRVVERGGRASASPRSKRSEQPEERASASPRSKRSERGARREQAEEREAKPHKEDAEHSSDETDEESDNLTNTDYSDSGSDDEVSQTSEQAEERGERVSARAQRAQDAQALPSASRSKQVRREQEDNKTKEVNTSRNPSATRTKSRSRQTSPVRKIKSRTDSSDESDLEGYQTEL